MRAAVLALATLLTACSGGGGDYSSVEDCDALDKGNAADDCYARFAPELFKADAAKGVEVVESRVSDQQVRDFIWLTVTREVDPSSYKYCDRIKEPALAERCRVLVSRPHLHRELLQEGGGGPPSGQAGPGPGAPGGPPKGSPPPKDGKSPPPPGGAPGGGPPPPGGGPPPPGGQGG